MQALWGLFGLANLFQISYYYPKLIEWLRKALLTRPCTTWSDHWFKMELCNGLFYHAERFLHILQLIAEGPGNQPIVSEPF